MQENITGVVQSWLEQNREDVFSSVSAVKEIISEQINNIQNLYPKAETMIQIFLNRSDPNLSINSFPPTDFDSFISFLCLVENSVYRKFAIIYFLIYEFNYTSNKTIDDVYDFANLILVSREEVQFVLGCTNLDSSISTPELITQLTFKCIPNSLEFPILSSLLARKMFEIAFVFYTCKKPRPKTESDENSIIIYTLVFNSRLYEALKYIRGLNNQEQKKKLIKQMFDLSIGQEKEREFSNLSFTKDEEDFVLNFDFPSENHFKRFCLARRRFDKFPEGEYFKCSF